LKDNCIDYENISKTEKNINGYFESKKVFVNNYKLLFKGEIRLWKN